MRRLTLSLLTILACGLASVMPASLYAETSSQSLQVINVNKASVEELQTLKGVGPVLADRVIAYRSEHGPFQKIEDLMNVKGIGQPTYEKIKDQVTL